MHPSRAPVARADDLFTLPAPLDSNLEGFAGPFATWFLYRPARALLDAGEGIASRLGNRVYLPEVVFLTHPHYDHLAGLPGFLLSRTSARGDAEKPVTIYYPKSAERGFETLRRHVASVVRRPTFRLTWRSLAAGDRIPIRNWIVEPFAVRHSVPAVGYRFLEKRRRLKAAYRGKTPAEIVKLKAGEDPHESYEHVVLAITGDTGPGLDPALVRGGDVLLHEATFLDPREREGRNHATAEEALRFAAEADVKSLVLYHISQRSFLRDIRRVVPSLRAKVGFRGRLAVVAGYTHQASFY